MRRRTALATGGALLAGLSAGCLETFRREDAWRELVVDPPEGVYVPPHADGMVTYGTATAGGREIGLLASRPHSFWIVADAERNRADIRSRHDVHLMATVRDAETGTFVPASVRTAIRTRGDATDSRDDAAATVDERSLWPMLSQRMGPHYGDNVPLEGDGRYTATIRIGATTADAIGGVADGLETETSVEIDFAFETDEIEDVERRLIDEDEGRGEADALEPMGHAVGAENSDKRDRESAATLGRATSADVEYAATLLDGDAADRSETDRPVLAVTARTVHNAYPLPFASLSAAVSRGGERVASAQLEEAIDARLGHCYRTAVDPSLLDGADELAIDLETPPQVARHEGYETAFLEGDSVTMALDAP
ncbi:iron transporter [Haloterrigena sp. SYSU A558-1]|uniref:Iron transporter n=1 Tax=Haloterrigena gelatinilytica TaxID=2741724 RepID=A0A8J8GNW6_9EURY|nr:iron transporter [Haloterrigena gelatinilytica]NUB91749.1 iron transporter [Haloterrigena gelatinilytica]NUC72426.1 iron transporter [Haloterrigena gelatinilytica]